MLKLWKQAYTWSLLPGQSSWIRGSRLRKRTCLKKKKKWELKTRTDVDLCPYMLLHTCHTETHTYTYNTKNISSKYIQNHMYLLEDGLEKGIYSKKNRYSQFCKLLHWLFKKEGMSTCLHYTSDAQMYTKKCQLAQQGLYRDCLENSGPH